MGRGARTHRGTKDKRKERKREGKRERKERAKREFGFERKN